VNLDPSAVASLAPEQLRGLLPGYLASIHSDPEAAAKSRARTAPLVAQWSDESCRKIVALLATLGSEQRVYFADPRCRELSRAWCVDAFPTWKVVGLEHLRAAMEAGPTVLVGNHCSYIDTSATDALLAWSGAADLADRIFAVAGPKVYGELFRLVASSCLNTLPVPQSTSIAHAEQLPTREIARRAIASLEAATEACRNGLVPLIYPEGSRTRTGRLGPFLKATHRYLDLTESISVVPCAVLGTREAMPTGVERVFAGPVELRFGEPLPPGLPPRERLRAAHEALAHLLPEDHRPLPDTVAVV
jgi:1-acyl-sn-glycerol-3-phosphate acyltransferase